MTKKKNQLIEQVKKIRQETGAGVIACKKALEEAKGDYEKALKILKKKGMEKAEEKQSRETKEGYVATYTHATGRIGVALELLCETDFVSRNKEFRSLAQELCLQVAAMSPKNTKKLLNQQYIREPEKTIDQLLKEMIAKFGENIKIGSFQRLEI